MSPCWSRVPRGLSSSPVLKMATLRGRRTVTFAMPREASSGSSLGAQAKAAFEHPGALRQILAAATDVLASNGAGQESDPVVAGLRFFLHHHSVCTRGHRGPGHDADAVPGGPLPSGLARKGLARHGERHLGGEIRQGARHSRPWRRCRRGREGSDLLGQDPIQRLGRATAPSRSSR